MLCIINPKLHIRCTNLIKFLKIYTIQMLWNPKARQRNKMVCNRKIPKYRSSIEEEGPPFHRINHGSILGCSTVAYGSHTQFHNEMNEALSCKKWLYKLIYSINSKKTAIAKWPTWAFIVLLIPRRLSSNSVHLK